MWNIETTSMIVVISRLFVVHLIALTVSVPDEGAGATEEPQQSPPAAAAVTDEPQQSPPAAAAVTVEPQQSPPAAAPTRLKPQIDINSLLRSLY